MSHGSLSVMVYCTSSWKLSIGLFEFSCIWSLFAVRGGFMCLACVLCSMSYGTDYSSGLNTRDKILWSLLKGVAYIILSPFIGVGLIIGVVLGFMVIGWFVGGFMVWWVGSIWVWNIMHGLPLGTDMPFVMSMVTLLGSVGFHFITVIAVMESILPEDELI